jgi:nitrite reductase/ring-hydroxylating ferredoxin subunit
MIDFKSFEKIVQENIEYIKISKSKDIYESKSIKIQFEGDDDFQLAVFRVAGNLYCLGNICPHRHADRIHEGIINNLTIMCPMHGWTYSLETGQNINQKQGIKSLMSIKVIEIDENVYIEKPNFKIPKWRR